MPIHRFAWFRVLRAAIDIFIAVRSETVVRIAGRSPIVSGAVLEIGLEPADRHAVDLDFLPVVVEDACGVVAPDAAARSM